MDLQGYIITVLLSSDISRRISQIFRNRGSSFKRERRIERDFPLKEALIKDFFQKAPENKHLAFIIEESNIEMLRPCFSVLDSRPRLVNKSQLLDIDTECGTASFVLLNHRQINIEGYTIHI